MNKTVIKYFLMQFLIVMMVLGYTEDAESKRTMTIRLRANDFYKDWVVNKTFIDASEKPTSTCDILNFLILKDNLTWEEVYLNFSCYKKQWLLVSSR